MDKPRIKQPLYYLIAFLVMSALAQISCGLTTAAAPTATPTAPATLPTTLPEVPTHAPTLVPTEAPTTTKPAGGPLYVVINPAVEVVVDLQNSFVQTANDLGANAKMYDDNYDPKQDLSLVKDAIQAGAKGVAIQVFAPVNGLGANLARTARAAGVVLVAIETPIKDDRGKPIPMIRFDDREMGTKVGEAAAKLLTESGWLKDPTRKVGVLSLEVSRQPSCNLRTEAEKAAIKAAGVPNKQIFPLQYDNIMIDSQNTTGKILKAHPEITNWVVFGCDDHGVAGSLKALAVAGVKTEDILAVGLGGSEACLSWTAGEPTGFKAALNISYQDLGKTAATVLNDAVVNGKIPPAVTIIPSTIVDATNFKTSLDPVTLAKCSQ